MYNRYPAVGDVIEIDSEVMRFDLVSFCVWDLNEVLAKIKAKDVTPRTPQPCH